MAGRVLRAAQCARDYHDRYGACRAERRVERAEARLQLWQAELQRWQTELAVHHTPKQQRTEEAAAVPDHPRVASGGANPPNWHRYYNFLRSTFQKLETQEQDRRAVPIDRGMLDHDLPRGGEIEVK